MGLARSINYSRDAERTLRRIDQATARRIRGKLTQYAEDPESLANNVKQLQGIGGLRRLRVGEWRVIFTETLVVVAVIKVAPRGSAYH